MVWKRNWWYHRYSKNLVQADLSKTPAPVSISGTFRFGSTVFKLKLCSGVKTVFWKSVLQKKFLKMNSSGLHFKPAEFVIWPRVVFGKKHWFWNILKHIYCRKVRHFISYLGLYTGFWYFYVDSADYSAGMTLFTGMQRQRASTCLDRKRSNTG